MRPYAYDGSIDKGNCTQYLYNSIDSQPVSLPRWAIPALLIPLPRPFIYGLAIDL